MATPDTHTSPPLTASERGPLRCAVIVWIVFALGICAATLAKPDLFVLTSGVRFTGRATGETDTDRIIKSNDFRTEEAAKIVTPGVVRIPKADIAETFTLGARSVTPEYDRAARLWWKSQTLYTGGEHGFLYMPQSAIAYSPFTRLPPALEETLWRILGIAAYAVGIWGLCHRLFGHARGTAFLLTTLFAIPAALGSATNGQTNLHMAGLFALTTCSIMGRRWWFATLWLMLALACKPTSMVMILLFGAIWWPQMSWRLAIGIVVFLAAPFLHTDPSYVLGQYIAFAKKAALAGAPTDRFQDIRGMLESFGLPVPVTKSDKEAMELAFTAVRGVAALVTLGLCILARLRFRINSPIYVLALGAIYLMLFNPRTEGLSYVILGPAAALWATRELLAKRWPTFAYLFLLCLAFQFSTQLALNNKNYWVRPLGAIGFAALVIIEIARRRDHWRRYGGSASPLAHEPPST